MTSLRKRLDAVRRQLPPEPLAVLASICFSLGVLTAPFGFYIPVKLFPLKLFAAAFYAFALHWLFYRPPLHFPPIKLPLAAFLWTNVISAWWAASLPLNRQTWYMVLIFGIIPLAGNVIVSQRHLETLCQALFLQSAIDGIIGIVQFVRQYQAVLGQHPDQFYYYMTAVRIRGFTIHWVHFGCQQMLFFVTLLAFLLLSGRAKPIWWMVTAIIGISIALNFTRSVWLGCLAAGVYLAGRWKPRCLWLIPVVVVASYLAAPSLVRNRVTSVANLSADPSAAHRREMWGVALRMIRRHPWVGVGPENIEQAYALYLPPGQAAIKSYHGHLHSNFLQFAAERGLPTLAAWIGFMLTIVWHFWRLRPQLSQTRWIADAAIATWLAIMVQGCFDYNFGIFSVLTLFLFLVSTPFVAQEIESTCRLEPSVKLA